MDSVPLDGDATLIKRAPCSLIQRRYLSLHQKGFHPHVPVILKATGNLDLVRLEEALNYLLRRHPMLRARFLLDEAEPVQEIAEHVEIDVRVIDLSLARNPLTAATEQAWNYKTPFDLKSGPTIRAELFRVAADCSLISIAIDHVAADVFSGSVLLDELSIIYGALTIGEPINLPPPLLQYTEYALWEREWLGGEGLASVVYWRDQLAGIPIHEHERDGPASVLFTTQEHRFDWASESMQILDSVCARAGITRFMGLIAIYALALNGTTGRDDLVILNMRANRHDKNRQAVIGSFANLIPLRIRIDPGQDFRTYLHEVRQTCRMGYVHENVPFGEICNVANDDLGIPPSYLTEFRINLLPSVANRRRWSDDLEIDWMWYAVHEESQISPLRADMILRPDGSLLHGIVRFDAQSYGCSWAETLHRIMEEALQRMAMDLDAKLR